jgi:hypothetical protein
MLLLVLTSLLSITIGQLFINKYSQGLKNIPGPWQASFTNLWRFFVALGRRPEVVHKRLHRKYGDVVRMGPNFVSITDLETVKKIFSPNSGYIKVSVLTRMEKVLTKAKSDMYPVQQTISHGKRLPNLFNTTDEVYHAKLRRAVASTYSMTTLIHFEPLVNSTITTLVEELEKRFADKNDTLSVCDFGEWLHFFAFDVIGELTWSKRLGFVEKGIDIEGIIQKVEDAFAHFAVVCDVNRVWNADTAYKMRWGKCPGLISSGRRILFCSGLVIVD